MNTPHAFFVACDIPFLKKDLVETILDNIEPGVDIVIPETSKGLEPLCSVYSKNCLKPIEQQLVKQQLKIQLFFQKVRVKKLPEPILRKADPNLLSFSNVNTPEDLARAEHIAKYLTQGSQFLIEKFRQNTGIIQHPVSSIQNLIARYTKSFVTKNKAFFDII